MKHPCESCGMPIEAGPYCEYCLDDKGQLQAFTERFERMVQWQMRKNPGTERAQAERETYAYMAKMPAWRDHPEVKAHA